MREITRIPRRRAFRFDGLRLILLLRKGARMSLV